MNILLVLNTNIILIMGHKCAYFWITVLSVILATMILLLVYYNISKHIKETTCVIVKCTENSNNIFYLSYKTIIQKTEYISGTSFTDNNYKCQPFTKCYYDDRYIASTLKINFYSIIPPHIKILMYIGLIYIICGIILSIILGLCIGIKSNIKKSPATEVLELNINDTKCAGIKKSIIDDNSDNSDNSDTDTDSHSSTELGNYQSNDESYIILDNEVI